MFYFYIHFISRAFNFHKGYFCHGKSFRITICWCQYSWFWQKVHSTGKLSFIKLYSLCTFILVIDLLGSCNSCLWCQSEYLARCIFYAGVLYYSMIFLMFTEWITVPSYMNLIGDTTFIYSVQYINSFAELPVKFVKHRYRYWKWKSGM